MGTKQARNFGGRPTERQPEPGKKAHMSLAVPLTLKRKVEQAAKRRGWSASNEAAHRLEMTFAWEQFGFGRDMHGGEGGGLLGKDAMAAAEQAKKKRSK